MAPPANRFGVHDTQTRLALVESHLEEQDGKLDDLVHEVRAFRSDFTELRIELAEQNRKHSTPPDGIKIGVSGKSLALLVPLAAGFGAGVLKLIEFFAK